jgi:hypothetical protein
MGIIDKKRKIADKITTYTTIRQNQDFKLESTYNFNSLNNASKEPITFMIDLISIVTGSSNLKNLVALILIRVLGKLEQSIKNEIKKLIITPNADVKLGDFIGSNNLTFDMDISTFDRRKEYSINPNLPEAKNSFKTVSNNNVVDDFDSKMKTMLYNNQSVTIYDIINMSFNPSNRKVNVQIANPNIKASNFINTYVDSMVIINKEKLVYELMDYMFGFLSNKKKSKAQIKTDLEINELMKQILEQEGDIDLISYRFSEDLLNQIENDVENISNGIVVYDYGCGNIESNITTENVDALNDSLDTNDIDLVSNNLDNLYNSSLPDNTNDSAIKDSFYKNFIKGLVLILTRNIIFTPKLKLFLVLAKLLKNPDNDFKQQINNLTTYRDDLNEFKRLITCLAPKIKDEITEFIFTQLKKYLKKLVIPVAKAIIEEKAAAYARILKSLIPIKISKIKDGI